CQWIPAFRLSCFFPNQPNECRFGESFAIARFIYMASNSWWTLIGTRHRLGLMSSRSQPETETQKIVFTLDHRNTITPIQVARRSCERIIHNSENPAQAKA